MAILWLMNIYSINIEGRNQVAENHTQNRKPASKWFALVNDTLIPMPDPRVRAMNNTIREAAASTGARLIDFAAYSVGSDPRLWSEDRFHVNAEGHARIAAALAQALGLPGTDDAWQQPLPEKNARSRWTRMAESWSWYRHHFLDHLLSSSAVEGKCYPKRPRLEAVHPRDGFESLEVAKTL
jgi:hypothetical protein